MNARAPRNGGEGFEPRPLDEILEDALELPPSERAAFLDAECGDDDALRAEIESLLAVHDAHPEALQPSSGGAVLAADLLAGVEGAGEDVPAAVPRRIGRYPVVREIGRGGMGVVYEAEDETLQRRIAVKVLPRRLADNGSWRARFAREAQLLAALNHPNIATIHSLEEADGVHFLTMELVSGTTLAERMDAGSFSPQETLVLARQIASALEAAHERGITHCDLKPMNVRITGNGRVKLVDFGLARSPADAGAKESPFVMGTPGYMSPEQIRGEPVDRRADIWAYGCILYECLSGRRAFEGDTQARILEATLRETPRWDALPPATPQPVRALLTRCLDKDASSRLSSIRIVRSEVEQMIGLDLMPEIPGDAAKARTGRLPFRLDRLVGRKREREEVAARLSANRLLTLTGSGGSGKTRLALSVTESVAHQYPDGIGWVDLAAVTGPELVLPACAAALRVAEGPGLDLEEAVAGELRDKCFLLVLDNGEHVLDGCRRLLSRLLPVSTELRVLVTSREALRIPGEALYHVPTLPPEEAVELFLDRARAVAPHFSPAVETLATVREICRRLDGIPLAVELAAARVRVLSPEEIALRLEDRFQLLRSASGEALPRHRTLEALIGWSHDLMTPPERALFRRLAVFAGGFGLDAVEAVSAGEPFARWDVLDLLTNLVDKSLVESDAEGAHLTGRPRFRMLETIREYARQRLREADEEVSLRARHLAFFLRFGEEARPQFLGTRQIAWLDRITADHGNVCLALEAAGAEGGDVEAGLRLVTALLLYWIIRGHWVEGRRFTQLLLERSEGLPPTAARAHALLQYGDWHLYAGELDESEALCKQALALGESLEEPTVVVRALHNRGGVALFRADYDTARDFFHRSLEMAERNGRQSGAALALNSLGVTEERSGNLSKAAAHYERSLERYREAGDRYHAAVLLTNLGAIYLLEGELDRAEPRLLESLEIHREMGTRWGMADSLRNLSALAQERGDRHAAIPLCRESIRYSNELGARTGVVRALYGLAIALSVEDARLGARLMGAADAHRTAMGIPLTESQAPAIAEGRERLRAALGDDEAFESCLEQGARLDFDAMVALALGGEGDATGSRP